jgi:hypothetical protein
MKHTPGPWRWEWDSLGIQIYSQGETEGSIATVHEDIEAQLGVGDNDNMGEANARLIAAAPEMYAALKDLMEFPKSCGHEFTCSCPEQKARAAIAKAEAH